MGVSLEVGVVGKYTITGCRGGGGGEPIDIPSASFPQQLTTDAGALVHT